MQQVNIPIVEGKYKALFPQKCVYCGESAAKTLRHVASAGSRRRRRTITVDVPYCEEHARTSRRNAAILTTGFVLTLLLSCCVLFAITSTFVDEPAVGLWVALGLVALVLAVGGSWLLRRVMSRVNQSMADMVGGSRLGLNIQLAGSQISFTFANDEIAEEFARLNNQR
jgi:hypothetical protein